VQEAFQRSKPAGVSGESASADAVTFEETVIAVGEFSIQATD
jgi:hypothetical protein